MGVINYRDALRFQLYIVCKSNKCTKNFKIMRKLFIENGSAAHEHVRLYKTQ